MTSHRLIHSVEDLRAWLPVFQSELVEDFRADDDTRAPRYYTLRYSEKTYGIKDEYAHGYDVFVPEDEDFSAFAIEEYAQSIIDDDPDLALELAEDNEAGFIVLNGEVRLADADDFAYWIADTEGEYGHSLSAFRTRDVDASNVVHLTRKAANADIKHSLKILASIGRSYAHHTSECPDLERLLELVYALDLEKSTLVFKREFV